MRKANEEPSLEENNQGTEIYLPYMCFTPEGGGGTQEWSPQHRSTTI